LEDEQLAALHQLAQVPLDGVDAALVPRLPIELSAAPATMSAPPKAGEHSRAILQEAGFNAAEIEELLRTGVCRTAE